MQLTIRRYDDGRPCRLTIAAGRIARAEEITLSAEAAANIPWGAPGLVDLQVNGYGGHEFSSANLTAEKVVQIVRQHYRWGVTRLLPTITTNNFETLAHGMRQVALARRASADVARAIVGIHLEGPYFSREDGPRGAHPLAHVRPPDWDEFQKLQAAADGLIRLHTMSPEFDTAPEFIAQSVASGVNIAVAHMDATGEQIRIAVDAGASLSTHLGNGAHRMLRRHPNYIWDQLAEDRLIASLIVDGQHLPPEVVKVFVRAKTPERCILVSDVSGYAGLPTGKYGGFGGEIEMLADGRLVIAGQTQLLAGASRSIDVCVVNVMKMAGVTLCQAIDMASRRAAQLIGAPCGGLRPGDPADLVLFRLPPDDPTHAAGLGIVATLQAGECVYGKL